METRANFVLIGIFTLAVIAAAFGFVLWFQNLHSTTQRTPLRIIFVGPAQWRQCQLQWYSGRRSRLREA
jgi:phospholipid/cholesterol/gamma-HCH transport system substrate-binding protein